MSFSAAWLDLREPADAASRDTGLLAAAAAHVAAWPDGVLLDLGCGTGATFRAFGSQAHRWCWRLVDRDPDLLARAASRCGTSATAVPLDLAEVDLLPLDGVRLVTASALLDLASAGWVHRLAGRLAAKGIGIYAALSYDGAIDWAPPMPADAGAVAAFNAHQRRDKGLGPALGPGGAAALAEAMAARGFEVTRAASPWRLGPAEAELQRAFVTGVAEAAAEAGCAGATAWGQARRAASAATGCTVGHVDVLALPRGTSTQSKITSESSP